MAKKEKITLTLDFNVEKQKLQEISNLVSKDVGKGLQGTKTIDYFNSLKTTLTDVSKVASGIYTSLSKPLVSKAQAKELANNLGSVFKGLDNKLLSLQGNIGNTFGSVNNVAALKQIRQLGDEIDNLTADYQKASQLLSSSRALGNKGNLKSQLTAASKELDILNKKQGQLTAAEKTKQTELKATIDSINKALAEKLRISEQVAALQAAHGASSQAELQGMINNKVETQQGLIDGSISVQDMETLKSVLEKVRDIVRDIMNTTQATGPNIEANIDDIKTRQKEADEQARSFKSVLKDLGLPLLTLNELASTMRQVVRYSYDYVKNLDKALTEISVVSGKTRSEVLSLTDTFIELSAKTGMAIDDIAQASTIFYQQGLDDKAVEKMTEYTALFAKISGEDVPTAADQLTAAINGFGFSVSQAGEVVDKMSVLAAYSAADIDELATAMSKGASQAAMAGLTFDEYNAYLATMIETTREAPENLGTSLKTIMSRFQSIKTGDNTEDDTDVNDVEKALKSVGVQLRDSQGQLRELGDVLNELGPKWNSLDRNTQAYLGTVVAGTRQQSRFVSLMQNWDRALELTAASENSAGAATKMHAAAMEGLEASLMNLTNAWQKLISNIVNGDSFKWIIDALTGIVKWFGEGSSILKIFTIAMVALNAKTLITNLNMIKTGNNIKNLDTVTLSLAAQVKKLQTNIEFLKNPMSEESQEILRQTNLVRGLIDAYNDLTTAKATGAATPDGVGDSPVDGAGLPVVGGAGGKKSGGKTKTPKVKTPNVQNINNANKATGKFNTTMQKFGAKVTTVGGNIMNLVGTLQMGLMVGSLVMTAAEGIADLFTTTADELKQKAQEAYDKTQKEIDKRVELMASVEANVDIYDRLSKKMNKSAEEVDQLAEAAEALAEAAPGALIGYDKDGNAIIDTTAAKAKSMEAEKELADYAKEQMGNIGNLSRAELKEQAEANVAATTSHNGWQTGGLVAAGTGATALGAMGAAAAANIWNPAGWALIAATAVTALGLAVYGAATASEQCAISEEELRLAREKAKEVQEEYQADLLKNMSYITNSKIKDRTIDGASVDDRTSMANYVGNEWLQTKTQDLLNQLTTGEISEEEYEEAYKNLGDEWERTLNRIDDRTLASAYNNINKVAEDIGGKTYEEVEKAINDIITNKMGISEDDELFKVLQTAFFKAAYSGTDMALYAVINGLENRKSTALSLIPDTESDKYKNTEDAYNTAISNAKGLTGDQLNFYSNLGITDDVDLFNNMLDQYGTIIKEGLVTSTEAATVDAIAILAKYRDAAQAELLKIAEAQGVDSVEEIDYEKLSEDQRKEYDKWVNLNETAVASIDKAWNSLDISIDIPWKTLWENFEELTERALTARETLAGINGEEGIDVGQWKDFTSQLDKIDFSMFDAGQLLQYSAALDTVAGSLEVVDGQIYANGEALATIADLEEQAIQASIAQAKTELINKQIELEASKAVIDAQIATLEWKIAVAEGSVDAEAKKSAAEQAWLDASNKMNTFYVQNQAKVTEALVTQYANAFSAIATKYNQLQTAMADGLITGEEVGNLKAEWDNITKDLTFQGYSDKLDTEGYDLSELKAQLGAAKKASAEYAWQISNINVKLATLDSGIYSSENGVASGKKQEELKQYIGKLKEIYNIENRIALLEHRLGVMDTYSDIAKGDLYAEYLGERIKLTDELLDQHAFLTEEQKKFTNGYKDLIESSAVADVFSFDKYGQIIIDFEKYTQLQDTAANGEKSLKEQADELYDTYTEMFEELHDDFDAYISYLQKAIELQEEMVDAYIEMESNAADAVKEIYEKILDTKLEAIDKEKEALEELRNAREQARKDQDNAEEISNLQTDIQRTMMDSSGASDISFIKAQNDMNDKLEEIADDKYSEMLDNIIDRLEQEQDALQENFDELFENQEWLFAWLDEEVMRDQDRLTELLTQTDEWATSSEIQRAKLMEDWDTQYATYMQGLQGGKTIMDVWSNIGDLRDKTLAMDEVLKTTISNTGHQVANAVKQGVSSAYSSGYSAGNKNSTYTANRGTSITPTGNTLNNPDLGDYDDTNSANFKFIVGKDKVKITTNGILPGKSPNYYDSKGVKKGESMFEKKGKVIEAITIPGMGNLYRMEGLEYFYKEEDLKKYKFGGMADFTGPAWLDGTPQKPEAVLNALQTEHFIKFTNALDNMFGNGNVPNATSTVSIDTISFNVESMSSPEDGEAAFNMFVNKFKEIGSQSGIKIDSFKSRL